MKFGKGCTNVRPFRFKNRHKKHKTALDERRDSWDREWLASQDRKLAWIRKAETVATSAGDDALLASLGIDAEAGSRELDLSYPSISSILTDELPSNGWRVER